MKDLFDLTGKVALVTGGTHGIGLAIGLLLARAGAKVCVNDLNDHKKLKSCRDIYKQSGLDVFSLKFNVTDEVDVDRGITLIEKNVGPVPLILINNAGIIKRIPIIDMKIADYKTGY